MTELPKSIRVGAFSYKIEGADHLDAVNALGKCANDEQRIFISSDLTKERRPGILLHEIIHAVDNVWSADLKEKQVTQLEHGLTQALQDIGWMPKEIEK